MFDVYSSHHNLKNKLLVKLHVRLLFSQSFVLYFEQWQQVIMIPNTDNFFKEKTYSMYNFIMALLTLFMLHRQDLVSFQDSGRKLFFFFLQAQDINKHIN